MATALTRRMRWMMASTMAICGMSIVSGCSTMSNGNLQAVAPVTQDTPRVGNVYLFRGIVGIFSTGLDHLGVEINQAGVHADVYQDDQWEQLANTLVKQYGNRTDAEPLVMVGHSWGADHIINIAQKLDAAHVPVTLILTLDPVTPPEVPGNVLRCENLYETGFLDFVPVFRGVQLKNAEGSKTDLVQYNLHDQSIDKDHPEIYAPGVNHFSIEKDQKVHEEVIKQILAVCPTREVWKNRMTRPATPKNSGMMVKSPTSQPAASLAAASN